MLQVNIMTNLKWELFSWGNFRLKICKRLNEDLKEIVCGNTSLKSRLRLMRQTLDMHV
jgi:hypothetical protein